MNLKRRSFLLSLCVFVFCADSIHASVKMLQTNDTVVIYGEPLSAVAKEVASIYPAVKDELVKTLAWEVDFRPEVVLVNDRDKFRRTAGGDMIIAFALPERNIIVLDTSRVYTKPFTLETTLKHELCHLILHRNIAGEKLPRWLDEGVCQWASGGIAELMTSESGKALAKAVVSERLISLSELERFPSDERSLILAYEESKSIVEYIVRNYERKGILHVLGHLKEGDSVKESIQKGLSVPFPDLEKRWYVYLKREHTWFSYLSDNLYTILFSLAAVVTVYGFIRLLQKKRAYKDEEEESP